MQCKQENEQTHRCAQAQKPAAASWKDGVELTDLLRQSLQESRATLERLKRMAGFESQDFDPLVRRRRIATTR